MENQIQYLNEWLELAKSGDFYKAQELYYEKLFGSGIENFCQRNTKSITKGGVLLSILGLSPEPIILTARAVNPDKHIIFTTNNRTDGNEYLEKYLGSDFEMVYMDTDDFNAIYRALKEQLVINPSSQLTLDITGGKKSMVAAASIFGKDYGCKIVYVDFSEYLKELRKPMPGSEVLNIVYDPLKNQPELFLK